MTESITRSITVTEVDAEAKTFKGIFAPYNEVIEVDGAKERYERGLFADYYERANDVPVHFEHDIIRGALPVGRVESLRDTEAGTEVEGSFFDSDRGREVHQILKSPNGYKSLSANFFPTKTRNEEDVTVYEKAELIEVSVVRRGAYPSAKISEVRNDSGLQNTKEGVILEKTMTIELKEYDDSELRSEVADLKRRFEVNENKEVDTPVESKFRSIGEYVKGIADSDEEALSLMRAYTGGTSADSVLANGWASDIIRVVNNGRPVLNAFSKGQWVANGSNIEYAKLNTNTINVASQGAEGNDLVKGKVSVTSAYAPKVTYGGWTEMSLQEVKDSSVNILDVAFQAMAAEYAAETEAAVRAAMVGATPHTVSGSLSDADGWVNFIVDAAVYLDGKGLAPEFLVVSADNFKALATLDKADGYVLNRDSGSIAVTGLSGRILNLPFVLTSGSGIATVAHSSAIKTFEQPGSPISLSATNIVNLTDQFSLYGRMAVAVQDANALVEVA